MANAPYCQQKLPVSFEDDLLKCFDAQYQEDIVAISNFKSVYVSEMSSLVRTFESNLDEVLPGLNTDEYQAKVKNFKDAITINTQRIEAKVKEPTKVASLEDTDSLLLEIGSIIDQMNVQIEAHNTLVGDKKNQQSKCGKEVWEYLAFVLQDAVKEYNDKYIADFLDAKCTEIDALTADIQTQIDTLEQYKRSIITETVTKGLNPDVEMKDSGVFYMAPMNAKWRLTKIGYICTKLSRLFTPEDTALICSNSGKVLVRPDDVTGKMVSDDNAMQGIHAGDIAIHGMDTWHGAIALSDYDGKITRVIPY